ncbi:Iron(3+)-hydroxamate-binding protein FhuD [Pandoraea iniqua]|uniref:Iron(3+)-hydroxamate-binding protein FhuD n=1 Tax=Pandoraea iniqua TaxID=2508288 RepID=A0A5E4XJ83_9BURK|nr:ABC transporter substrate-binding protein [Pandoraea iniqua]VVE36377.1 Iron(3+)-hydroxamate-binding protein FhuD [Pandoraea iniqua]
MKRRSFCAGAAAILAGAGPWVHAAGRPTAASASPASSLRILAPDRGAVSSLLALGIEPVAGADRAFYDSMGAEPRMPPGMNIVNSGDPIEPNLELMIELGINWCVTVTTPQIARERMGVVAPVTHLDIFTGATGALDRAADGLRTLARMTGREEQASAYIAQVEARMAEVARTLAASGRPAKRQTYLVTLNDGGRSMVAYGRNSIMWDVMTRVGLRNAWTRSTNEYGFSVGGVELLAEAPDADIVVVDFGASTTAALRQLAVSPFWNRLASVRAGRVYRIPLIDLFNSYPSATTLLRGLDGLIRREDFRHV